jgi:DNA repair protein RadA
MEKKEEIPLTSVKGIGEKIAQKLKEKNITTIEELAATRPEELKDILQTSLKVAKEIINSAKAIALDKIVEVMTAKQVEEYKKSHQQLISTGSKDFDDILGGGVRTDCLTGLTGEFSSGKTQVCFQLAVNCIADLNRNVGWVETEPSSFSSKRISEMAKGRGLNPDDVLNRIFVIPASSVTDPFKQLIAYEMVLKKIEKENIDIGLLVIDSFNAKFRTYYTGREMLSDRSQEIAAHIGFLESMIASRHNVAVVLTAQIYGIPDIGTQLETRMKFGDPKRPYGGEYFLHAVGVLVHLTQIKSDLWKATVVDASDLPKAEATFKILTEGIR